jgi:hypothetical protein
MAAGYYLKQHGDDFIIMDTCKPYTEDRHPLLAKGVIWATGFRPDYHWVNLPVFDETGRPRHMRRVVPEAPGLSAFPDRADFLSIGWCGGGCEKYH